MVDEAVTGMPFVPLSSRGGGGLLYIAFTSSSRRIDAAAQAGIDRVPSVVAGQAGITVERAGIAHKYRARRVNETSLPRVTWRQYGLACLQHTASRPARRPNNHVQGCLKPKKRKRAAGNGCHDRPERRRLGRDPFKGPLVTGLQWLRAR